MASFQEKIQDPKQLEHYPGIKGQRVYLSHWVLPRKNPDGKKWNKNDSDLASLRQEKQIKNWDKYVGMNSVRYIKTRYASRVQATKLNNKCLKNTIRETTEEEFSTYLQFIKSETDVRKLLRILIHLKRQRHKLFAEVHSQYKKKQSTRYFLGFSEDKLVLPANPWTTFLTLQCQSHPAINKLSKRPFLVAWTKGGHPTKVWQKFS